MNALFWIAVSSLVAFTHGLPKPQSLVAGVFIPADALKSLQDRANANSPQTVSVQTYQPNTNVQNTQSQVYPANTNLQNPVPVTNQGYQTVATVQNPQVIYQPVYSNQPQYQPVITVPARSGQPVSVNQVPLIIGRIGETNTNQPTVQSVNQATAVVPINQPTSQNGQSVIYVQQQLPNQQTVFVPQTNQPQQSVVYTQPSNQGFVIQNGQGGQPTRVIFANPSNGNQVQLQGQNSNTVYTLIPLNSQNLNSNTGSYLIPTQSGNSNPIVLSTG